MSHEIQQAGLFPEEVPAPAQVAVVPAETSMLSMIERLARDPQFDADKLEKLLAMKERLDKEEARKAFFVALRGFQTIVPPLIRTRAGLKTKAGHVVNHYLPLDQMLVLCQPYMRQFGLSHRFQTDVEKKLVRCYAMHELGHEECSEFPFESVPNDIANKAQQFGSGQLYAMRYAFKAVFGLAEAGTDTDATPPDKGLDDRQKSTLLDLYDNLPADRQTAFMSWLITTGPAKLEDLPAKRFHEISAMLKKATGQ